MVLLPIHTVSESNAREHWTAKQRRVRSQRGTAMLILRSKLGKVSQFPLRVTLVRIAPRELDDDNLRGALKACRDGVADWLGIDDRDRRVAWGYGQERGSVRLYQVRVHVEHA